MTLSSGETGPVAYSDIGVGITTTTVSDAAIDIALDGAGAGILQVDRSRRTVQADEEGYSDAARTAFVAINAALPDAPTTPDVVYIVGAIRETLVVDRALLGVDGNKTQGADLPTTGRVSYEGLARGVTPDARAASGTARVLVNYDTGRFQGRITDVHPDAPDAVFRIVNSPMNGVSFEAPLASDMLDGVTGQLRGDVYGADADQAAGVFRVESELAPLAGIFALRAAD